MDGVVIFEIAAVVLAVFGSLAVLFGADSRPSIEDTHEAHDAVGNR